MIRFPKTSEEESGNVSSEEKVDDLNEASTEVNIVMVKVFASFTVT